MARPIRTLSISADQRRALHAIVNRPSAPHRDNRRAWIILNRADGLSQSETARKVGVRQSVVVQWEQRFRKSGIAGLSDAKGRGPQTADNAADTREDHRGRDASAKESHAMVGTDDGQGDGRVEGDSATALERQCG